MNCWKFSQLLEIAERRAKKYPALSGVSGKQAYGSGFWLNALAAFRRVLLFDTGGARPASQRAGQGNGFIQHLRRSIEDCATNRASTFCCFAHCGRGAVGRGGGASHLRQVRICSLVHQVFKRHLQC
ncbi:hypothetical protein D3C76_1461350 [compost metagenome]